ncbi:DNA mismatch repair protein MutL [Bacillus mesophilus]|uniref:DNA mismatch repair protein MutL n=1 Tax=Bacillus mesophilus TaxID=1808955 RepID=A0A6M0Q3V8_9BACI|nr:DNA mismatch repair protein MutL [Bacillus mesophilus]NEY70150.1 DNA mismatch repair endonuclease MutL [Bacillus mesophilus]
MGIIRKLDDALSNKIAAGEVVERPASVVKELVENSIDAGSTIIEVEIEEAGLSKIRIIDNGHGIEEDDCLVAFERHATSKIKDEIDLFRIRTLGFRGEALPSIASVSELEIKTSTGNGPGTLLSLKGGKVVKHEKTNSRKGTEITVKNLFFNTPARLKYMKTVHTELGNITDTINRISMAYPEVSFKLTHNGNRVLYTNGSGDVLQVLASIYGMSIAKKLLPIKLESLDFKIKGYVSLPEITRASRNYLSVIINGRYIKNFPISKAIQDGYHTLLPIGRFPIVFVEIEMDPLLVDVNVHPAKLEVRVSKEPELHELLKDGIKALFKKQQLIPAVQPPKSFKKNDSVQESFSFSHTPPTVIKEQQAYHKEERDYIPKEVTFPIETENKDKPSSSFISEEMLSEEENSTPIEEMKEERIPPLYPIGQMHGTYILAQNENGLFIIDQHAAQERVKYEFYREKVGQVRRELQDLLVPLTLEYSHDEYLTIEENKELLQEVGIFLEDFGPQSYIVRAHPQWFPEGYEAEVIEEIIQQVLTSKKVDIKKLREETAIMMSCKGSIKANHYLRETDIFPLLESLRLSEDPFTCPHGRPIIIHFSTYEMEKLFKRVM